MRRLVLLLLAACSIPGSNFSASPDSGATGDDQPSKVLAIVPSATAVELDERASKDITVALSQPPAAPLTVALSTQSTALGISTPTLTFTPANFDQPQTVSLAGLADPDTSDAHADVVLSAAGVDTVTIAATVHDLDRVAIVTSGASPLMIQEGSSVTVNVHLSAQPAGDVSVAAVLGAGPVTVSPANRVFTASNYDADQTFTFSAPPDANTVAEDQTLTFRATGVPDKVLAIRDIDIDVQTILVDVHPSNATLTEQGATVTLDVSLSRQPSSDVVVSVSTTTGAAHVNVTDMTFHPGDYSTKKTITVDGPADTDTADNSDTIKLHATDPDHGGAALDRSVPVTIKDDDTQRILSDAPVPLVVNENTTVTFAARLAFKPSSNVTVSVVSQDAGVATASPGTLTFTPTDYDQAHTVTVRGVHDNDLVAASTAVRLSQASIGNTDVAVNVPDVDRQAIVLSTATLSVPEGTARTFDVSLMFDPGGPVTVSLASSNGALVLDRASIGFTSSTYSTPIRVTVNAPVDSNATAESSTITVSGGGAASAASLTATVAEATVVQRWGWYDPFQATLPIGMGTVVAYKLDVGAVASIDSFHTYVPTATGEFRMALYTNVNEQPGNLVAEMAASKVLTNGVNDALIGVNPTLTDATYFLVIRFSQTVNIGYAPVGTTGRQCLRNFGIPSITSPWPSPFGASSCTQDRLMNLWITTHHQ